MVPSCYAKLLAIFFIVSLPYRAISQGLQPSEDPLRHGHALLIGNSHYRDPHWPSLDDVPIQLDELRAGLAPHFDTVEEAHDLDSDALLNRIESFLRQYGNDSDARLFIYYAGHGYTEVIPERNERRGYITGVDTPWLDGKAASYDAARLKSVSMRQIRAPLEDARAKSVLFILDSCFSGAIFTDRSGAEEKPLSKDRVALLLASQARDFITAGKADQRVPAHSPIPDLLLAAISGGADHYKWGVVSTVEIWAYLLDGIRSTDLTPQEGRLDNPAFAQGTFLFRTINPTLAAPSESETIRIYRAGVERGEASAQVSLGYLYERGEGGLAQDKREAARLYKLAADQGYAYGQADLGVFYDLGDGGLPKDKHEAARLYKLAADQGNGNAQVSLGLYYERGEGGLPQDKREAARLYRLAADQENAYGRAYLADFYERGDGGLQKDLHEAARLYRLSAEQGIAYGQTDLARFYEMGEGGLPKDTHEAARLYKLAADKGSESAQVNLARLYERGDGVPKDTSEAARLYKLAADQGNGDAQIHLGSFYENGDGGLPKDEREAARLYRLAADQGNAYGETNLGLYYERGNAGLPRNAHEAARLYKLAADQGNAYGEAYLGDFYERGDGGLPKDASEAARLYKLAADQGNAYGQAGLKRLSP